MKTKKVKKTWKKEGRKDKWKARRNEKQKKE